MHDVVVVVLFTALGIPCANCDLELNYCACVERHFRRLITSVIEDVPKTLAHTASAEYHTDCTTHLKLLRRKTAR